MGECVGAYLELLDEKGARCHDHPFMVTQTQDKFTINLKEFGMPPTSRPPRLRLRWLRRQDPFVSPSSQRTELPIRTR